MDSEVAKASTQLGHRTDLLDVWLYLFRISPQGKTIRQLDEELHITNARYWVCVLEGHGRIKRCGKRYSGATGRASLIWCAT